MILLENVFNIKQYPGRNTDLYNSSSYWHQSGLDIESLYDPIDNLYQKKDIIYSFNEYGFRCDNFNNVSKNSIVFLGCSVTEGVGVRKEESWSYIFLEKIKKETNIDFAYYNLSLAGCGLDSIIRAYYNFFDVLKPKIVIAYFPQFRKEFLNFNNKFDTISNNSKVLADNYFLLEKNTVFYENCKNMSFLEIMLQKYNTKLIWNYWGIYDYPNYNGFKYNSQIEWDKKGKDKSHPGPTAHNNFANSIFNETQDFICANLLD